MKTVNPYWKARIFWAFLIGIAAALFMCASCNPEKIAARKDRKALERVETNISLLNDAWTKGSAIWPCANDTSFVFRPGKTDSIYFPVMYDTADRDRIKDSIMAGMVQPMQDECNEKIKKAFDLGMEVATKEVAKIKIPVRRPDTLAGYIVDRELAKSLLDTLAQKKQDIFYLKGRSDQWQAEAAKQLSEKLHLFWWLLAAVALLVGSNILWVFAKFKKP